MLVTSVSALQSAMTPLASLLTPLTSPLVVSVALSCVPSPPSSNSTLSLARNSIILTPSSPSCVPTFAKFQPHLPQNHFQDPYLLLASGRFQDPFQLQPPTASLPRVQTAVPWPHLHV